MEKSTRYRQTCTVQPEQPTSVDEIKGSFPAGYMHRHAADEGWIAQEPKRHDNNKGRVFENK